MDILLIIVGVLVLLAVILIARGMFATSSSNYTNDACGSDEHYSERKKGW